MHKSLNICATCGSELMRMEWNSKCDLLVCNNGRCRAYREPVETILTGRGEQKQQARQEKEAGKHTKRLKYQAGYRLKIKSTPKGT